MSKNKNRIVIFILFSVLVINSTCVITVNSMNHMTIDTKGDSLPKAAVNANINAWIIVAGDRESDHALYYAIENGCDEVYDILVGLGYAESKIYYLAEDWDGSLPAKASDTSEKGNIQYAIETWAADKVNSVLGLGIFLFDHGGTNVMGLPGPNLYDTELNSYLNTLEADTGMTRSVIVYEACHSGSFIDPVSKDNRIVICATDSVHSSYANSMGTSAVFTEAFWSSISVGYSLGEAFENAKANVVAAGYIDSQKPWIDDNHDEIGHEVDYWGHLPNGGDGNDALNLHINPPMLVAPWIYMDMIPLPQYIDPDTSTVNISIRVGNNNSRIEHVRVQVIPPGWQPPVPVVDPYDPFDPEIYYFPTLPASYNVLLARDTVSDDGEHGDYIATIRPDALMKLFGTAEGDYRLLFEAKTEDHVVTPIVSSSLTINEDGEAPDDLIPPTITIINPVNDAIYNGTIDVTARGNDDQALDKIQLLIDGKLLNETTMPSYLPYPEAAFGLDTSKYTNEVHNITAIAYDEAGNKEQTSVFVNFKNSVILNFNYSPYLIGAGIGVVISVLGSLIFRRKKK
ncbi:C13 family peptidase [Promethearchaeum syntrophicum]|uniref:C13 family peptidase n=1 Tax=Promethearchaeum syntrophicum TaxID=2594042 RepID=A0A5B9DEC4_9ARCH|nr:C13 family peptidase [Candidatus Prometheoarchaeum syntrophicum]QEE17464.1 Peptidase C13 family protein [Candidatus Prometheoarchaeum syntrophicum]